MNLEAFLNWIPTILGIGLTIGGLLAIRQGYSKRTSEIQESVINSLNVQNATQEKQIQVLEKEVARLKRVVSTIRIALKRRGLQIEIDGDYITLTDDQVKRSSDTTVRITHNQLDEDNPILTEKERDS